MRAAPRRIADDRHPAPGPTALTAAGIPSDTERIKRGVILGGTLAANRLRRAYPPQDAAIVVVDQDTERVYQPGLLFVPFGQADPAQAAPNVFALGDATDVPTSTAGSVAHFEGDVLVGNVRRLRHPGISSAMPERGKNRPPPGRAAAAGTSGHR
jgi:NADH dehydrogenase FAD-containing subunit